MNVQELFQSVEAAINKDWNDKIRSSEWERYYNSRSKGWCMLDDNDRAKPELADDVVARLGGVDNIITKTNTYVADGDGLEIYFSVTKDGQLGVITFEYDY